MALRLGRLKGLLMQCNPPSKRAGYEPEEKLQVVEGVYKRKSEMQPFWNS